MEKLLSRRTTSNESGPAVISEPDSAVSADRLERISVAAYYRAEARRFAPGHEIDDWLKAEAEIVEAEAEIDGAVAG